MHYAHVHVTLSRLRLMSTRAGLIAYLAYYDPRVPDLRRMGIGNLHSVPVYCVGEGETSSLHQHGQALR